jgi:hypothetical protein
MVEIYKGELRDLLIPKTVKDKPKLEVKLSPDGRVEVKNAEILSLSSTEACSEVFERGLGGRKIRKT